MSYQTKTVYGVEYAIEVYCKNNFPSKNTFVEWNLIRGLLPTPERIYDVDGNVRASYRASPPEDGNVYTLVAHLHSHNIGVKEEVHHFANPIYNYKISNGPASARDMEFRSMRPNVRHYVVHELAKILRY